MLIWQGRGAYAFVFFFFGLAFVYVVGTVILGEPSMGAHEMLWLAPGLLLGGAPTYYFGRKWNDPALDRTLVDPATGQSVVLRRRSTFWFVPMQYWGIIQLVAAPLVFLVGFTGH